MPKRLSRGARPQADDGTFDGAGWWSHARRCPSPNVNARPARMAVTLVVIHSISLPPGEYGGAAVERLFTNRLDCAADPYFEQLRGLHVSAHFFIRRDGACVQFASVEQRAWHAGVSAWRGRANCNDFAVGIELEGLEGGPFEAPQYATLKVLLKQLARRHPIRGVAGHEHIAPGRKGDPGAGFHWARLRRGLGWPDRCFPGSVVAAGRRR